jgi:transglutaminase-like putative cysteine protease
MMSPGTLRSDWPAAPGQAAAPDRPEADDPVDGATLALLLAGAVASSVHQLSHLAIVASATLIGLIGWRVLIWRGLLGAPGTTVLRLLVPCVLGIAMLGHARILSRETAISLLALFLGLKLLETRSRRDALVVVYLSFFLIVTGFVLAQTPAAAIEAAIALWLLMATLISLQSDRLAARFCLRRSGWLLAQALPLAAVLFLLFPRTVSPLWGITQTERGSTGLGDSMRPGSIGAVTLSDAIALRARFDGPTPPRSMLYWRGPVFERFDGETWSGSRSRLFDSPTAAVTATGPTISYMITLEPHENLWMPALEMPIEIPTGAIYQHDYQLIAHRPVVTRTRYRLTSALDHDARHEGSPSARERLLYLPPTLNPSTRALADSWRREGLDDEAFVARASQFIRDQGLLYTLQPGTTASPHMADVFLFERKSGFCEHFASAFAILMRAGGLPARIVTGYQGGDLNPIDGQVEVRQDDAHAWTEVLIEGRWRRIDPTAIAQPRRIDLGMARAVPAGDPVPMLARVNLAWFARFRHTLSALGNVWNQYVLGFDRIRQDDLMASLGLDKLDAGGRSGLMAGAIALLLAGGLMPILRGRRRTARHERLWRRLCRRLAAQGLVRASSEGPLAFATRVARARPDIATAMLAAGHHYSALRYGVAQPGEPALAALARALHACRRLPPR